MFKTWGAITLPALAQRVPHSAIVQSLDDLQSTTHHKAERLQRATISLRLCPPSNLATLVHSRIGQRVDERVEERVDAGFNQLELAG